MKGLSEFEKKQKEIDLQHNLTVNEIKFEIFNDRESFLKKIMSMNADTTPSTTSAPASKAAEKPSPEAEKPQQQLGQ